jgi:hypothetical protein
MSPQIFGHKLGTFHKYLGKFWDHLTTMLGYERQDEDIKLPSYPLDLPLFLIVFGGLYWF